MAEIHIQREHDLTREQVRAKVGEMAQTLAGEFKVKHAWDGDVLRFERSGASGAIAVGDKSVDVKVKLGMVLVPIKGKIENAIRDNLDQLRTSA